MFLRQSEASGKHSISRSPTPLNKEITSTVSLLARFEGEKVAYLQFPEDRYGTAGSFKTGAAHGSTAIPRDRKLRSKFAIPCASASKPQFPASQHLANIPSVRNWHHIAIAEQNPPAGF
jgi:hypothetical protein